MGEHGQKTFNQNMRRKMLLKFFTLVGIMVGGFIIIASVGVFAFLKPAQASEVMEEDNKTTLSAKEPEVNEEKEGFFTKLLLPPKKTSFLVMGLDKSDMLADVIILGCFDRDSLDIDLINVPRDTYTELSSDLRAYLKEGGRSTPNYMKMTELHSYGGAELGGEAVKRKLQETFDIEIDYMVHVDIDAFKEIVDAVGPITMEIPAGGLSYSDPIQNLNISIPGGVQELDGEMAEGVVRFRSYKMGDLQRIEMQQQFLKELFKQTLEKETLINNAATLIGTFIEYVDTDFGLDAVPKYLPYLPKLSGDNLITQTLPGTPIYINNGELDVSFYELDLKESQKMIDDIFKSVSNPHDTINPDSLKIELSCDNSSIVEALELKDVLGGKGHQVIYAGTNSSQVQPYTQIIVRDESHASSIKEEFDESVKVIVRDELKDDYEALIILGKVISE